MKIILKIIIFAIAGALLLAIAKYWYADYLYANGKVAEAVEMSPLEPLYKIEMAKTYAKVGGVSLAEKEIEFVRTNHPRNVKLLKEIAGIYDDLNELEKENEVLRYLSTLAPTDAQIWHSLALSYGKIGEMEKSKETALYVIEMKPNYKLARKYLANIYLSEGEREKAKDQYEYILEYISPDDQEIHDALNKIM